MERIAEKNPLGSNVLREVITVVAEYWSVAQFRSPCLSAALPETLASVFPGKRHHEILSQSPRTALLYTAPYPASRSEIRVGIAAPQ
jgi:hypothetical protein